MDAYPRRRQPVLDTPVSHANHRDSTAREPDATAQLLDVFINGYMLLEGNENYLMHHRDTWEHAWIKFRNDVDRRLNEHSAAARAPSQAPAPRASRAQSVAGTAVDFVFGDSDDEDALPEEEAPTQRAAVPELPDFEPDCGESADIIMDEPQQQTAQTRNPERRGGAKPARKQHRVSVHAGKTADGTPTPHDMHRLWKLGRLEQLMVSDLKGYLKIQHMPVSGTKQVLLQRVVSKLQEEEAALEHAGAAAQMRRDVWGNAGTEASHAPEIEVACREAPVAAMEPVDVALREAPHMRGKAKGRKGRIVMVDDDDDDIEEEANMLRAPSPDLAPRHSITESILGQVPRASLSSQQKAGQWAANVAPVAPRTSTSQYSEIGAVARSSVAASSLPSPPSFFNCDGFYCDEPSPEHRKRQMKARLDRYGKAHAEMGGEVADA